MGSTSADRLRSFSIARRSFEQRRIDMTRRIAVALTLVAVLAPIAIPPAAAHPPKRGGVL